MAVTSLWHIKGNLKDLIDYVENPNKTVPKGTEDFFNVFSYIKRPEATDHGAYVTAINCLKEIALQQMILTKKQYGKGDQYIAWHGYQSFKVGEVEPKIAHQIGLELAREMWGDRFQIIVTTHLDKAHIHNHFCFNSVSFRDGMKYNYSKSEMQKLRDCSDRLCREHQLSVIQQPRKAPARPVWLDEKAGKPTRYNIYRSDIQEALYCSNDTEHFERYLRQKGYEVDLTGQHWKLKLPRYQGFTRMDTLNSEWTPQKLTLEMIRTFHTLGNYSASVNLTPKAMPYSLWTAYQPHKHSSGIYRLYLYYCYQIGALPPKTTYRPTSPYLKESLRYLDKITAEVNYMASHKIETLEDLLSDRSKLQRELDSLIRIRGNLQNRIRRADPEQKAALREEKQTVTDQITGSRKQLKCNLGIEERSKKMQDNLDLAFDSKEQNRQKEKERGTR